MKSRILLMLNTPKKKAGAAVLCGALITALCAGTAFASNSNPLTSLQVKMANGVRNYSTDDGKTWSQNAPNGVTVSDNDGKVTILSGNPPKDSNGQGILSKVEDGVRTYSTDGGKTWSLNAPAEDGVTIDENGKINHTFGTPPKDGADGARTSLMVKLENGVKSYSTDEGKTWSTNAPSGVTIGQNGEVTMSNGAPPKDGEGKGILSKVKNGIATYSTDGGKTWSSNAPAGVEDSETIGEYSN